MASIDIFQATYNNTKIILQIPKFWYANTFTNNIKKCLKRNVIVGKKTANNKALEF